MYYLMEIMKITKIRGKKIEKTNSKTTNKYGKWTLT